MFIPRTMVSPATIIFKENINYHKLFKYEFINELDEYLFNGLHKNERIVAILLDKLMHSLPHIIDPNKTREYSPIIIRNQTINLQKESVRDIFPILSSSRQKTTDIDILFINVTSIFGHRSSINYYVEVEMADRDEKAYQRLFDFSNYCTNRGIALFPILVTNRRVTRFIQNCCIINISELISWSNISFVDVRSPLDVPGVAWDDSAIVYHILDLISRKERYPKNELITTLSSSPRLFRFELDFDLMSLIIRTLYEALKREDGKSFRRRMHDLLRKMEQNDLIKDTPDKYSYQLSSIGADYIIKWWGDVNV